MASVSKLALGGPIQHAGTWDYAHDNTAMFLKVFAGEVLTAFEERNIMLPLTRVRTIQNGKSAQFPVTGTASAEYFQAGEDILVDDNNSNSYLSNIKVAEKIIKIDDMLISSCFIHSLDEAMSHYNYRAPFSVELGRALANTLDKNIIKQVFKSGSTTGSADPLLDGMGAVNLGTDSMGSVTTGGAVDAFFAIAQKMDEGDISPEGRWAVIEPELYYRLIQDAGTLGSVINRDFTGGGSNGSVQAGTVMDIAGIKVYKSNHIKDVRAEGDQTSGAKNGENNDYQADFSLMGGIFGNEECVGTLKLKDISMEQDYLINRQGDLLVAKMALGTAPLRNNCAGFLKLAS